jgi:putative ABC transport system substrate-binding protein
VKRREFIAGLASAAVWHASGRAQQSATPTIGLLDLGAPDALNSKAKVSAFLEGLKEAGYVEGRNVTIEYRWAEFQDNRLRAMAADLVKRRVTLIAALGIPSAAIAAKAATSTIPIVFAIGGDPVKLGLVQSLNRPSGNLTGVSFLVNGLGSKRLGLLGELVPAANVIGFLVDPSNPNADPETADMQMAAEVLRRKLLVVKASSAGEIDAAIANLVRQQVSALVVAAEGFFASRRTQLVALANRHAIPAMFDTRGYVEQGGLLSYGTAVLDAFRLAGIYSGRIIKGEKPADLPVQQSTKFELVINLKTGKALGLTIPEALLATADEVIQ